LPEDPSMIETQTLAAQEDTPNAPEWAFAADIPPDEKDRLKDEMIAAFKTVYDPEIPCDIYELGLIYKVEVDDGRLVRVEMTLTAPGCPVAGEITESVEAAIGAIGGTSGIAVDMVFEPRWDQIRMSEEARVSLDLF
jgi:FeS assembly SUF system protein